MAKTKVKDMSVQIEEASEKETEQVKAEEAAAETLLKETEKEISEESQSVIPSDNEESPTNVGLKDNDSNLSNSLGASELRDSSPATPDQDDRLKKAEPAKKAAKGTKKPKKGQKIRSKKYQEKAENIERAKLYPLNEAVEAAKGSSYSKFEGTFEIHIKTNAKSLRGLIALPFVSGKKLTILAFGKGADESGADIIGDDAKISEIQKGKLGFDVVITTPEWMPKLAKTAAILGPRGLMPNPKSGTITENLKKAVTELQSGKTEYKTEKGGQVIHLGIGKVSQPTEELTQNIKVLLSVVGKSRVKKVSLAPSMGPAVRLDLSSI